MRRKLASYRFAKGIESFADPETNSDGVAIKAVVEEEGTGVFEAVVAVFGNVDLVGDRIVKGAFAKSLERWKASGDPIPVIFDHQWGNLDAHAGEVIEAEERDEGLWIKGQLDLEDDFARKLFNKLKRRRIKEFSFAYDVVDEEKADDANELRELEIIEVGPTLKGANPETRLVGVKSEDGAKKAYVALAGSLEERARKLRLAVDGWVAETFPADDDAEARAYGWVEATFEDSVVVCLDDYRDPENLTSTQYEITYSVGDDGEVALGEAREVEVVGAIQPKSRGMKAGRVLSAKNEAKISEALGLLTDVLASVQKDDEAGGKALGLSEGTMTPADVELKLRLLELQAV